MLGLEQTLKETALKATIIALGVIFSATGAAVASEPQTMPSSEAVRLTHRLEQSPLGITAKKDRSDLIDWAAATPDVTITVCDVLGPIPNKNLPYGPELLVQAMFGNGAFQIEHPEFKGDEFRAQLAGITSMLYSYERILEVDPSARVPEYDQWLVALKAGRLEATVGANVREKCVNQPAKA